MSGDDDQPPRIMTSEVQGQLDGLSKEIKEMAASITTLVKAIRTMSAAQSGLDGIMDPQMVPDNVTDPRRAQDTESVKEGNFKLTHKNTNTWRLLGVTVLPYMVT